MSIVVEEGRLDEYKVKSHDKPWKLTAPTPESIADHERWVASFRAMCEQHDEEARERKAHPLPLNEQ